MHNGSTAQRTDKQKPTSNRAIQQSAIGRLASAMGGAMGAGNERNFAKKNTIDFLG